MSNRPFIMKNRVRCIKKYKCSREQALHRMFTISVMKDSFNITSIAAPQLGG